MSSHPVPKIIPHRCGATVMSAARKRHSFLCFRWKSKRAVTKVGSAMCAASKRMLQKEYARAYRRNTMNSKLVPEN